MQIQSPVTKTGWHHGEAIRENDLRRICLCIELGLNFFLNEAIVGDAHMSSGSEFQTVGGSKVKLKLNCLVDLVNYRLKFWYIKEIGNALTVSSIGSSAIYG